MNLVGKSFGRLTVLNRSEYSHPKKGKSYWECRCSCGNVRTIQGWSLTSGNTKSCGCLQREIVTTQSNRKDLVGMRFHKLLVLSYARTDHNKKVIWLCQCDCGNQKEIIGGSLISGRTRSCGCMKGVSFGDGVTNRVYGQYKRNAELRGLSFELSKEEFCHLTGQECYYCGIHPSNAVHGKGRHAIYDFMYNGVDRLDNSKGYTTDNCFPCCVTCNKAKNNHSVDYFYWWVRRVYAKFGENHSPESVS